MGEEESPPEDEDEDLEDDSTDRRLLCEKFSYIAEVFIPHYKEKEVKEEAMRILRSHDGFETKLRKQSINKQIKTLKLKNTNKTHLTNFLAPRKENDIKFMEDFMSRVDRRIKSRTRVPEDEVTANDTSEHSESDKQTWAIMDEMSLYQQGIKLEDETRSTVCGSDVGLKKADRGGASG